MIARDALDGTTAPATTATRRRERAPVSSPGCGPDGPPTTLDRMFVRALLRRPVRYLRELLAEAERREQPDLARLARQVLAWRAGQRG